MDILELLGPHVVNQFREMKHIPCLPVNHDVIGCGVYSLQQHAESLFLLDDNGGQYHITKNAEQYSYR
jgi:hypothetical protein